jgi:hypothetical protein
MTLATLCTCALLHGCATAERAPQYNVIVKDVAVDSTLIQIAFYPNGYTSNSDYIPVRVTNNSPHKLEFRSIANSDMWYAVGFQYMSNVDAYMGQLYPRLIYVEVRESVSNEVIYSGDCQWIGTMDMRDALALGPSEISISSVRLPSIRNVKGFPHFKYTFRTRGWHEVIFQKR